MIHTFPAGPVLMPIGQAHLIVEVYLCTLGREGDERLRDFYKNIFRFRFLSLSSRLRVNKTKKGKKINLGQLERISAASSVGGYSLQLKILIKFFFKIVEFIWPGKILLCPRIFTKKFEKKRRTSI